MKVIRKFLKDGVVFICLVLLVLVFSLANSNFLSSTSIITILRQASITGILSVGLTHIMLVGGIDLSLAAMISFTGVLGGVLTVNMGMPVFPAILICLAVTAFMGFFSGTVIHFTKMPPLIATMAMMNIVQGLTYIINDGLPVYGIPDFLRTLGQGTLAKIPIPVIIWAGCFLVGLFCLVKTKFGRNVYAVGSNEEAARLSGINVYKVKVMAYVICGLYAGIAGIVMIGRLNSGQTNAGGTLYLDSLTACVVGGISTLGGEGRVTGIVIGVLIMSVLANGMVSIGMGAYWQLVCKGLLLMFAVGFDSLQRIKQANKA